MFSVHPLSCAKNFFTISAFLWVTVLLEVIQETEVKSGYG